MEKKSLALAVALLVSGCATTQVTHQEKFDQALNAAKNRNYPEALTLFQELETTDPKNPELLSDMAFLYSLMGNHEQCVQYADRSITEKSDQTGVIRTKAVCLFNLKEHQRAMNVLETLVQRDINDYVSLGLLAKIAFESGQTDQARGYLDEVDAVISDINMKTVAPPTRTKIRGLLRDMRIIRQRLAQQ